MARINPDDIETLRDTADVVEVISGYTHLKRSGPHTFKGLCPFHTEKTPSFTVDAAKGVWFCFGCSLGGNIYQFVERAESLPFPEAVEWLARKTNFTLRYEEMRPGEAAGRGVKARIIEANKIAAAFFHKALMEAPDAVDARRYLESRSFGRDAAERWQLGWAPGRDSLCRHLMSRGFSRAEIEQADLGRSSQRDGSLYDTFRRRVIFPTWNLQDDVVAFGARALGDEQPKYLNSAETPAFSKSRVMYGLNRAKSSIARGQAAIVVEGYTDVIALHEAGVAQAVATNGVALAETHFELLKKFTDRAVLMFDSDEAGKGATERGFGIHHRIGLEVLVAPLPTGRDPADVVSEDGPEAIKKFVEKAEPLLEFVLEQTVAKLALDTPEARARAVREATKVLGLHPDPIARGQYVFMAARLIGVDPEMVQRGLEEQPAESPGVAGGTTERDRDRRLPGHVKVEREALQLLLTRPREIGALAASIEETDFTSPARRELFRAGMKASDDERRAAAGDMAEALTPDALSLFAELTVGAEPSEDDEFKARELFARLKVFRLERQIKTRRTTLQDINPLDDPSRHDELFTQLVALEAERRDLLRNVRDEAVREH